MEARLSGHDLALDGDTDDDDVFAPITYLADNSSEPSQVLETRARDRLHNEGLQSAWPASIRAAAGLSRRAGWSTKTRQPCTSWRQNSASPPSAYARLKSRQCKGCVPAWRCRWTQPSASRLTAGTVGSLDSSGSSCPAPAPSGVEPSTRRPAPRPPSPPVSPPQHRPADLQQGIHHDLSGVLLKLAPKDFEVWIAPDSPLAVFQFAGTYALNNEVPGHAVFLGRRYVTEACAFAGPFSVFRHVLISRTAPCCWRLLPSGSSHAASTPTRLGPDSPSSSSAHSLAWAISRGS
jgi:hypothetical protein